MVGRTVLVRAPPHGWACCVGVSPPPWWGVLRWFVAPLLVGRAVLVRAPLMVGRAVSSCAPPAWWGVLRWFVAPLPVGRAVSVLARRGRGVWFGVSSSVRRVVIAVVLLAWPGLGCAGVCPLPCWGVPCLCLPPPLVGLAVSACSGFGSWCCSRLDARLVLLVRCCLRRRTAGVVGCWLSVVLASPGLVLCWCVLPPLLGRAVLVRGPPLGRACCFGAWSPFSLGRAVLVAACCGGGVWFGLSSSVGWVVVAVVLLAWPGLVLCWCVPPTPVGACRVCAWPPPWWGVRCLRVRVSVRGVVAGWMPGWFCWFAVVAAAVRPALSGCGCLCCLPGRGWCCAGACPPP